MRCGNIRVGSLLRTNELIIKQLYKQYRLKHWAKIMLLFISLPPFHQTKSDIFRA